MAWEDNESNKVIGHRDAAAAIIDLATCANKYGNMLYELPGLIKCTRKVNGIASEYDIQFTACGENLGLAERMCAAGERVSTRHEGWV
jgi:hypothetical protein